MIGGKGKKGFVIAISGVESAGKSTQIDRLRRYLESKGRGHTYLWTRPGYTPGIQAVKRLFRRSAKKNSDPANAVSQTPGAYPKRAVSFRSDLKRWVWLTIALLDLLWTYGIRIRRLRARGRAVLVDRHLLDAMVDFRVNFPQQQVERCPLFRLVRRFAVRPDAALLLTIPAAESAERTRQRGRQHWETLELLREKEALYGQIAGELDVQIIDGCQAADDVGDALLVIIDEIISRPGTTAQGR